MTPIKNYDTPLDCLIFAGEWRIHARKIVRIRVEADRDKLTIYFESGKSLVLRDLEEEIFPFVRQYKQHLKNAGVVGWDSIQDPPALP